MSGRRMQGVSLIELMIAMLIGLLLLIGLVQVFAASRTAYQMSEGLARVQENGRFAMDFLQRDIRMAGHFGCVNDQARRLVEESGGNPDSLVSHFGAAPPSPLLDFSRSSIEGFEAPNTAPGNIWNLATGSATPAVPTAYGIGTTRAGSDVVVLRYFSGEGIPVTSIVTTATKATIEFDRAKFRQVLTQDGVASPTLFGISDCTYADIFEGTTVSVPAGPGKGTITVEVTGANKTPINERFTSSPEGQTVLYRVEAIAYFVRANASGEPALYRQRAGAAAAEELVDGVESLQLLYGQDANPVNNLNGNIIYHNTAAALMGGGTEQDWRKVGAVQIGLLMRSPNRAAATVPTADGPKRTALGVIYDPIPNDGRYRAAYESTVALRNRLYGN